MTYDPDNIFAKILRGEIPSHKVYEDEHALAIMDAMPQGPGHALVIAKSPSRNLLDAEDETLARLLPIVRKLARAVTAAFAASGVTVMQFNEPAGGQTVFHLHMHVIPRHDGVPLRAHSGAMEKPEVLAAQAAKIRAALARASA